MLTCVTKARYSWSPTIHAFSLFPSQAKHSPQIGVCPSEANFCTIILRIYTSLLAQMVKNLPAMQETQVWPLSQENPLKKGMATHSSILAWRIPWTEEPGGLYSAWGHKESDMTRWLIRRYSKSIYDCVLKFEYMMFCWMHAFTVCFFT